MISKAKGTKKVLSTLRQNARRLYSTLIISITSITMGILTFSIDNFLRNSIVTLFSGFISFFIIIFVLFIFLNRQQKDEFQGLIFHEREKNINNLKERDDKHNLKLQQIHEFYSQHQFAMVQNIQEIVKLLNKGKMLDDFTIPESKLESREGLPQINILDKEKDTKED